MRIKKVYGEYKVSKCPFCYGAAITKNPQNVPVCTRHKEEELQDLKCKCGEYLDVAIGRYGPFFKCYNCGIINFKTGLEINGYPLKDVADL
ncbi:MAG: hypothetical protein ACLFN8_04420 [Candidatus Woesearchaeota archaeon]